MNNMHNKYLSSASEVSSEMGNEIERTTSFANAVSQHAFDKYGLNAAATTSEGNALISALDEFFGKL